MAHLYSHYLEIKRTGGSHKGPGPGGGWGNRHFQWQLLIICRKRISDFWDPQQSSYIGTGGYLSLRKNPTFTNHRRTPWEPPVIISSPPSLFSDNRPTHWGWIVNNAAASRENKGNEKPAETKGDPATQKKTADPSPLLPAVLFACVPPRLASA